MSAPRKVALVTGILVVAVCASLPFRRSGQSNRDAELPTTSDMPWRSGAFEIPLEVRGKPGDSPAAGLYDDTPDKAPQPAVTSPPRIERVGPPPELPPVYPELGRALSQPTLTLPYKSAVPSLAINSFQETKHRIVDGDTLQSLAQRYLGDASRAKEIFDTNPTLQSPNLLPVGELIVIPGRQQSTDE